MAAPRHRDPPPAGGQAWRPAGGFLVLALAVIAAAIVYVWPRSPDPPPEPLAQAPAGGSADAASAVPAAVVRHPAPAPAAGLRESALASAAALGITPHVPRVRDPGGDQTPDITDFINDGERPTMAEVIDRLHRAGVYGGLGAFSPPGTRPPLVGLAVPEDFPLPEGYVRHYQATDDGQRIEPILMFSPDYQFFDADNRPIAIPADRVVPPEMAPPGLAIRRIVIPAPLPAPGSGS